MKDSLVLLLQPVWNEKEKTFNATKINKFEGDLGFGIKRLR